MALPRRRAAMPFFDLEEQEKRSFLSVVRHTVLDGPLTIVRFGDSSKGIDGAYGKLNKKTGLHHSYWMYGNEVREILDATARCGPYGLKVIRIVSERWAICDDWGDLGKIWTMRIPSGYTLNAYFGFAKFQPKISQAKQKETGRSTNNSYPGGAIQLVTRIGPTEKNWITGPIRTLDASAKKLGA
jgi:hypothetical protein